MQSLQKFECADPAVALGVELALDRDFGPDYIVKLYKVDAGDKRSSVTFNHHGDDQRSARQQFNSFMETIQHFIQ